MGINNSIDACYLEQAKNLFKQLKAGKDGVSLDHADDLLSASEVILFSQEAKNRYIENINTDKNKFISVEEFARVLQRADQQGRTGNVFTDNLGRNNKVVDDSDLECDFAKNAALPFLLSEAKKYCPEKYAQIERNLRNGTFTITGGFNHDTHRDDDINLMKNSLSGYRYADAVVKANQAYELLKGYAQHIAPNANVQKLFFEKLASGEVSLYDLDSEKRTLSLMQDGIFSNKPTSDGRKNLKVSHYEETYNLDNLQATPSTNWFSRRLINLVQGAFKTRTGMNYRDPAKGTIGNDPIEKATVKKLLSEVLTDDQLKYYNDNILQAVDDPKKFAELSAKLGASIRKSMNLHGINQVISDAQTDGTLGYYVSQNKSITLYRSSLKVIKDGIEKTGATPDLVKQELMRRFISTVAHEYFHAKQDALTVNPPVHATPQEKAIIAIYKESFDNYTDSDDDIQIFGTIKENIDQPVEKSAHNLTLDVDNYIDNWFAHKK